MNEICNLTGHRITYYDHKNATIEFLPCGKVKLKTSKNPIQSSIAVNVVESETVELELDSDIPKKSIVIVSSYFKPESRTELLYNYFDEKGIDVKFIIIPDTEDYGVRNSRGKIKGVRSFLLLPRKK